MATDEVKQLLIEFLYSNNMNTYMMNRDGKDFLLIETCEENEMIESFLAQYNYDIDTLMDYEAGYCDEYTYCHRCENILRSVEDSYSWQPEFIVLDCELVCKKCLSLEELLESFINDPTKAISSELCSHYDLIYQGFQHLNTYRNQLFESKIYYPKELYKKFREDYSEVVFRIDRVSQFYMDFSAYGRNEEF